VKAGVHHAQAGIDDQTRQPDPNSSLHSRGDALANRKTNATPGDYSSHIQPRPNHPYRVEETPEGASFNQPPLAFQRLARH
jgi:hypothetical protein